MRSIFYFLLTNFAVMIMFGIVMSLLPLFGINIQSGDMVGLLIGCFVLGMGGSLISLLISKKLALMSVRGKIINEPSNNAEAFVFETVQRLSQEWGFKMPQIAIYIANEPNAFATGASKNNSLVAVSTGLLASMTKDEVEGVLGHEMAHIGNGDMVTMALIQGVLNTFVYFLSMIIASLISTQRDEEGNAVGQNSGIYFMVSMLCQTVFGALASIVSMYFSRVREYRADEGSARHVGAPKMIAALKRLQMIQSGASPLPRDLSVMAINMPEKDGLLSTHPSLGNRIRNLEAKGSNL